MGFFSDMKHAMRVTVGRSKPLPTEKQKALIQKRKQVEAAKKKAANVRKRHAAERRRVTGLQPVKAKKKTKTKHKPKKSVLESFW